VGFFSTIPRRVTWLIFAGLFNNIGIGYLLVYLTAFFPEIGVSPGVVGLLLGLEGAMLFLSIPLGIRSDRRGRKKILLIGSTIVAVPMIMMALTVEVPPLIVAALLFGVAESAFLSTWNAMIADQTNLTNRDAAFSLSFIVSTGGVAFGFLLPFFLPSVEALTGIGSVPIHRDLLIVVGILSLLTPAMVYTIFKNYQETVNPGKLIRGPNFRLLLKFSGINGIIGLGAGFIIPLIPTWLFLKFQLSDTVSGPVLAVSSLTIAMAAVLSPRISRKLGVLRAILTTQGLSTAFMLSLALVPTAALAIQPVHRTRSPDEHGITFDRLLPDGNNDTGRERPRERNKHSYLETAKQRQHNNRGCHPCRRNIRPAILPSNSSLRVRHRLVLQPVQEHTSKQLIRESMNCRSLDPGRA